MRSAPATSAVAPDADWASDFIDARKARLGDILEDIGTKSLAYLYDFGDGWEHTIKIEHLADPEPGVLYPRLIEVSGRCPPEDCGGPWGYAELLEAIKSRARTPRRTHGMDRLRLRSRRRQRRRALRGSCRPRQSLVSEAHQQTHATPLTRGLHRMLTLDRGRMPNHLFD